MPAALAMATTLTVLRVIAAQVATPGATLARMNALLCPDMSPSMFVTCLYAVLDPPSGRLTFANAGHNMPCLQTAHGVTELSVRGMPLGLLEGSEYEEKEIALNTGDRLLMYSDGLVEAHDPAGQMLGFKRLLDLVAEAPADGSLINVLRTRLEAHVGSAWSQEDDVTMLTVVRAGAEQDSN
jgi:serine phosphatase RsbU (regulator of sigma subunit)